MRRERLIGHGRLLTTPPETAPKLAAPLPAATATTPIHAPEPETEIFTSQFAYWVSDYDSDSESAAASLSSIAYMSPPPSVASSTPPSGTSTTVARPASVEIAVLSPVHNSVRLELAPPRTVAYEASRLSTLTQPSTSRQALTATIPRADTVLGRFPAYRSSIAQEEAVAGESASPSAS